MTHLWVYDSCKYTFFTISTFKDVRLDRGNRTAIFKVLRINEINKVIKIADLDDISNLIIKFTPTGWGKFINLIIKYTQSKIEN